MNQLIPRHQRTAVDRGDDLHAREQMAYAQFLAGMTFNNASLGYVHAMAHQPGGFYDQPHGVCNAVPQPHVQAYNAQVSAMNDGQGAAAIRLLARDVAIPAWRSSGSWPMTSTCWPRTP